MEREAAKWSGSVGWSESMEHLGERYHLLESDLEIGSWRLEVGSSRTEVGSLKLEIESQKSGSRKSRVEVGSQKRECRDRSVNSWKSEVRKPGSRNLQSTSEVGKADVRIWEVATSEAGSRKLEVGSHKSRARKLEVRNQIDKFGSRK